VAHDRAIPVVPEASFEARWLWAWSKGESPGIRNQVPTDESEGSARDEFDNDDTPYGAKKVAKEILFNEYGFKHVQYACLERLWTEESNWRYKAHNKRSGAHGIAQALPANKMDVVATDWRTNPVTQIRWGLRYISIRYETPCKALSKHKRSNWY